HGAPRDAYMFTGAIISYGGNAIVSSSGYEIGGSSIGVQDCEESADDIDDWSC
ncbi:hypothetical protein Tco_0571896, partial [Tanacetum coccineum]